MATSIENGQDGRRTRQSAKMIGQAMQQATQCAMAADPPLNRADWRVLLAIQSLTLGYHRLTDRIYNSDLIRDAGLGHGQVYRSLHRLRAAGVITWIPSGGRKPPLLGFPPPGRTVPHPGGDASTVPLSGGRLPDPNRPVSGSPTVPPLDGDAACKDHPVVTPAAAAARDDVEAVQPTRKNADHGKASDGVSEGDELAARRPPPPAPAPEASEPAEFVDLIGGLRLGRRSKLRRQALEVWREYPLGLASCVAQILADGSSAGLLSRMIRDGDPQAREEQLAAEERVEPVGVTIACLPCDGTGLLGNGSVRGRGAWIDDSWDPQATWTETCPFCAGMGTTDRGCPACSGRGHVVDDDEACPACDYWGVVLSAEEAKRAAHLRAFEVDRQPDMILYVGGTLTYADLRDRAEADDAYFREWYERRRMAERTVASSAESAVTRD